MPHGQHRNPSISPNVSGCAVWLAAIDPDCVNQAVHRRKVFPLFDGVCEPGQSSRVLPFICTFISLFLSLSLLSFPRFHTVRQTGSLSPFCLPPSLLVFPKLPLSFPLPFFILTLPVCLSLNSFPVAFFHRRFHPHTPPPCSLISCAWKIHLAPLIINKEAQLKSAEGTLDYRGKDPKDRGERIPALICPLFPPSFVTLYLSSLLSQSILNKTLWMKTKHRIT